MKGVNVQKLEKQVAQAMEKYPAIISAYLFGSVVVGFDRQGSDIDIAVRIDDRLAPETMFDLRLQLTVELEKLLEHAVDVIVLNTASLKMIHQVMTSGRKVYTIDANAETEFRLQKQKEYFDFLYYIEDDRMELNSFFGASQLQGTSKDGKAGS